MRKGPTVWTRVLEWERKGNIRRTLCLPSLDPLLLSLCRTHLVHPGAVKALVLREGFTESGLKAETQEVHLAAEIHGTAMAMVVGTVNKFKDGNVQGGKVLSKC